MMEHVKKKGTSLCKTPDLAEDACAKMDNEMDILGDMPLNTTAAEMYKSMINKIKKVTGPYKKAYGFITPLGIR